MKHTPHSQSTVLGACRGFKQLFVRCLVAISIVAATVQPGVAQTKAIVIGDGQFSSIDMASGRTLTVKTDKPFADILIGNTAVLDVFPLTDQSLYIQSKVNGTTNVTLYSADKTLLEIIDVRVLTDYSDLEDAIRAAAPNSDVTVRNVNNRIRLSGKVRDSVELTRILQIAQQYAEPDQPVINAIRVASAMQVELDVRIIEVERNSGRELGVNLSGTNTSGSGFTTGSTPTDLPFGVAVGELLEISGLQIDYVINALEARGLARRLANPKLITSSGKTANFVVGGEVPFSSTSIDTQGIATVTTSYREFGIRLNFRPDVLDEELIQLRLSPEVSDIDPSINVNGEPGFITRKAETTVSLRSGQSFAVAGLLQTNNARNVSQVPWLGQVPILGALFKSTRFQKRETDLVILVTPRLVRPARPGEPLKTPLDDTRSTNDIELFMLGMLEVDKKLLRSFREGAGVVGPYGHMIDLEFEDGVIKKK